MRSSVQWPGGAFPSCTLGAPPANRLSPIAAGRDPLARSRTPPAGSAAETDANPGLGSIRSQPPGEPGDGPGVSPSPNAAAIVPSAAARAAAGAPAISAGLYPGEPYASAAEKY